MKVLCFGEILWDVFDTEKKIGGAPLNFAAHLVKNGVDAAIYSAVGNDALGKEAVQIVKDLGIDTARMATVPQETGVCLVTLQNGTPDYNIKLGTAMDHIPYFQPWQPVNGLYFGTLAQRSKVSAQTLEALLAWGGFEQVFVDINIRQQYYTPEILENSIRRATILKLSREEMGVFRETGIADARECEQLAAELKEKYPKLEIIIITLDCDGAYVYDCKTKQDHYAPKPNCKVVSTVGGGDSFSATFFASVLKGESVETALRKASRVSEFVVTQMGAIPDYPDGLI